MKSLLISGLAALALIGTGTPAAAYKFTSTLPSYSTVVDIQGFGGSVGVTCKYRIDGGVAPMSGLLVLQTFTLLSPPLTPCGAVSVNTLYVTATSLTSANMNGFFNFFNCGPYATPIPVSWNNGANQMTVSATTGSPSCIVSGTLRFPGVTIVP